MRFDRVLLLELIDKQEAERQRRHAENEKQRKAENEAEWARWRADRVPVLLADLRSAAESLRKGRPPAPAVLKRLVDYAAFRHPAPYQPRPYTPDPAAARMRAMLAASPDQYLTTATLRDIGVRLSALAAAVTS